MPRPARDPLSSFVQEGVQITYAWAPDPMVVAEDFLKAAQGLEDTISVPVERSRNVIIAEIERGFEGQHDPEGREWEPLDPEYLEWKIAQGGPEDEILVLSGQLHGYAVSPTSYPIAAEGKGNATLVADTSAWPDWWIAHQEGRGTENAGLRAAAILSYRTLEKEQRKELRDRGLSPYSKGGIKVGSGNALPERAFVGISEAAEFEILEIFDTWLTEVLSETLTQIPAFGGGFMTRGARGRFTGVYGK